jgi:hypothetical protein
MKNGFNIQTTLNVYTLPITDLKVQISISSSVKKKPYRWE